MSLLSFLLLALSLVVLAQALFSLYLTLYSWEHPGRLAKSHGPTRPERSRRSFTVIVAARDEAKVIYETMMRLWSANYPVGAEDSYHERYVLKRRLLEIVVV